MTTNKFIYALLFILLGCGGSKKIQSDTPKESIIISQGNGGMIDNSGNIVISLERDDFEIEFFNKAYQPDAHHSAMMSFFSSPLALDQAISGIRSSDISYFVPGSGIAGSKQGYDKIWLDHGGTHYVYYADEKDKRATLIGEENGMLHLSFPVHTLMVNEKEVALKKTDFPSLYIAILIDRNLDGWIQDGELTKVTVNFMD